MIVQGSMRHSPSGRKRKTNAYKKKARPAFVARTLKDIDVEPASTKIISSKTMGGFTKSMSSKTKLTKEERLEISKQYTLAPAYNKGAYQVIPRGDVKWIGK
jgi:hypothetical protein